MEPFGQGNPRPVFLMKNVIPGAVRFMGSDETHARFTADVAGWVQTVTRHGVECVLFQRAQELKDLMCSGKPVDITGTVSLKTWRGRESVQFIIEEME